MAKENAKLVPDAIVEHYRSLLAKNLSTLNGLIISREETRNKAIRDIPAYVKHLLAGLEAANTFEDYLEELAAIDDAIKNPGAYKYYQFK